VQVQPEPLREAAHVDEDSAFAWLLQAEGSGDLQRHARRAIWDFEKARDDELPF